MKTTGAEKFSPRWISDGIRQRLDRFYDALAERLERARWVHAFNLLVFTVFAVAPFFTQRISGAFDIDLGAWRNIMTSHYSESIGTILVLIAIGTFAFYLRPESLPRFGILGFIVGVCALYFFSGNRYAADGLSLTINIALSFGIYLLFYFLRARLPANVVKWDFLIAAYLSLFLSYLVEFRFGYNINWYFELTRLLFIFSLLSLEYQARRNASPAADFAYIFSAMNILTPVPVEAKDRVYTDRWKTRVRGLADILIGLTFFSIAIGMKTQYLNFPNDLNFGNVLLYGFAYYLYYFFGSYAWIVLPVGIGRWFGMKLPDGFDLPLLATSPADRWRRWNTFYYHWFYKVLFFPIYKKTRSLVLAVVAVSSATIVVHAAGLNYGIFLGETIQLLTRNFILISLFFSAHGVLLYVSIRFPRLFPSEDSKWGWLGVAAVTFLMSLLHVLAPR